MATMKSGLASAKAKLAKVARAKRVLAKGDTVSINDRLWAIIGRDGRLVRAMNQARDPMIFSARKHAASFGRTLVGDYHVIRLGDISGIVQ